MKYPDNEPLLLVEWEDCSASHGWQSKEQLGDTAMCVSVGFCARDDDTALILVESRDLRNDASRPYGCATTIPRSQVRAVYEMKRGKRRV